MKKLKLIPLFTFVFCIGLINSSFAQSKNVKSKNSKVSNSVAEDMSAQPIDAPESTSQTTSTEASSRLKKQSIEIQKVIKNENGVIRGFDFGTPLQKIKEKEDAKYDSDGKDFIIYKVSVNEKEEAEIIYYLDEKQNVRGFGISFLVNAQQVANDVEATLIDDFQNYFTERYGKFVTNDKNDDVWTSQEGSYTLEMGDSSEGPELSEIEIEIFKKK